MIHTSQNFLWCKPVTSFQTYHSHIHVSMLLFFFKFILPSFSSFHVFSNLFFPFFIFSCFLCFPYFISSITLQNVPTSLFEIHRVINHFNFPPVRLILHAASIIDSAAKSCLICCTNLVDLGHIKEISYFPSPEN